MKIILTLRTVYYLKNYQTGDVNINQVGYPEISYSYTLYDDQQNIVMTGTEDQLQGY